MGLLLFHPQVALIDCNDCLKRRYNLETGQPDFYRAGPYLADGSREKKYWWGDPPACKNGTGCPKQTDEQREKNQPGDNDPLSPANLKFWRWYISNRAVGFAHLQLDLLAKENLAIVDSLYRAWERVDAKRSYAQAFERVIPYLMLRR